MPLYVPILAAVLLSLLATTLILCINVVSARKPTPPVVTVTYDDERRGCGLPVFIAYLMLWLSLILIISRGLQ